MQDNGRAGGNERHSADELQYSPQLSGKVQGFFIAPRHHATNSNALGRLSGDFHLFWPPNCL